MAPEFRYYDELPASGEWPGGKRYGYHAERLFLPRVWPDGDHERARALEIMLPDMDMQVYESWWDQPDRLQVELVTHPEDLASGRWLEPDSTVTFEQRTITAKRWRRITWSYVPPWKRHHAPW